MKTMTKKERRQEQLNRHYKALEALSVKTCGALQNGKKLSVKLLKIEQMAHQVAEAYCNGDSVILRFDGSLPLELRFSSDESAWDKASSAIAEQVRKLFGGALPFGFFVNGDPRGCALKLNNETEEQRELIADCGLQRDWGGYGLLAPRIE